MTTYNINFYVMLKGSATEQLRNWKLDFTLVEKTYLSDLMGAARRERDWTLNICASWRYSKLCPSIWHLASTLNLPQISTYQEILFRMPRVVIGNDYWPLNWLAFCWIALCPFLLDCSEYEKRVWDAVHMMIVMHRPSLWDISCVIHFRISEKIFT